MDHKRFIHSLKEDIYLTIKFYPHDHVSPPLSLQFRAYMATEALLCEEERSHHAVGVSVASAFVRAIMLRSTTYLPQKVLPISSHKRQRNDRVASDYSPLCSVAPIMRRLLAPSAN